jgi:hypothetical protein
MVIKGEVKMIAIHISDLLEMKASNPTIFELLLGECFSITSNRVLVGKSADDMALTLAPKISNDNVRLMALLEVLLEMVGPKMLGREPRIYRRGPRGGWRRLRLKDLTDLKQCV